jgi:hypothetical protein
MKIQISEEILKETINCKKNFLCLSDQKDLCEMESLNPQQIYFVKYPKNKRCI